MRRLLLVRHAPTAATERGAFAGDEPLTAHGRTAAAQLRRGLPVAEAALSSPALRCRQTAAALDLTPALDPDLAECRFGEWEGRTFAEIQAREPALLDVWLRDPDAAPSGGGESLTEFAARIRRWLEGAAARLDAATVVAITHAGVIRAAAVTALAAPIAVFWQIVVAPLSVTELRLHDGAWSLARLNWSETL